MNTRLIKVVVAGDGNVGQTSVIRCYTEGKFATSRVATIGVDFHTHTVELPGGNIRLSIWDMAGPERFLFLPAGLFPCNRAAAVVFDVTEAPSLQNPVGGPEEKL